MTRKKRQLVRNVKVYAVCGVMLCIAFGVSVLAGSNDEVDTLEVVVNLDPTKAPKLKEETNPTEVLDQLDYPFNLMSHDWGEEDTEGFVFHEISDECKKSGGYFPVEMQKYAYIICQQYGFDYEIVFALIERESHCLWDAIGDDGVSFGYMQIYEKWHREDMERLSCTDLLNPYQNILVGIDYLAQLSEDYEAVEDVLAAYNYGPSGAKKYLWNKGIHWYEYNEKIAKRANELKQEARKDYE